MKIRFRLSRDFYCRIRNFLFVMKLTILAFFLGLMGLSASTYSQKTKLSLDLENVTISDVFKSIESQSEFVFIYENDALRLDKKVSILVNGTSVDKILSAVLKDTGMKFEIVDKQVVITKSENSDLKPLSSIESNVGTQQAQKKITGTVKDSKGLFLPGVTVVAKGTTAGTITDADGKYKLSVPSDTKTLVFSFVGMKTQEIIIGASSSVNVVLEEITIGMEEVVVVGYGTQKKANLTGAVASVSREVLENKPLPNVGEVLKGVSPNLNVSLSDWGGEPGSRLNFNIRGMGTINGNDSPLILVDGVEMDINNLDPGNIESVSVLKDASASAIYGSRAPYGVILVTTKKGQKNEGVKIQYNNNLIMGTSLGVPHMLNSVTFATAYNQAAINAGSPPTFPAEQVDRMKGWIAGTYKTEYDPLNPPNSIWSGRRVGNANYDWPHILYKNYKFDQRHNVVVSGGNDKNQYYISLGSFDQNGFYSVGYDKYKRYDLLANFSTQATKWLRFDFSTKYSNTHKDYPLGITTVERRYFGNSVFSFGPNTPRYNIDGSSANAILRNIESSGRDKTDNNDLLVTLGAEFEPVKGWKTNVSYNYNITEVNEGVESLPVMVKLGNGGTGNVGKPNSAWEQSFSHSPYKLANVVTSYEKTLGGHYVKVLAGYEQEERLYTSLYGRRENLISVAVPSLSTALGASTLDDTKWDWATQGVFGRINYNYKEKYLLEMSGRENGSSRFQPGRRWGFYPSASAGYQISKEKFWKAIEPVVNRLKIRGSYGSLGNNNVPAYLYISNINIQSETPWIISDTRPAYALTPDPISQSLTWETITTANIGFDAGFLNNRLDVTFDWFNRKTTDMFGPQETLPYTFGAGTPLANNADLSTKGFELILNWKDKIGADFSYHAQISIGDNKTKILKYRNVPGYIDSWYKGKEVGEIWGYVTDKIIQTAGEAMPNQAEIYPNWGPGDMKYKDLNKDGKITQGARTLTDHGDLKVIGNATPRYNVGFAAGFEWKGFDFSMNWTGYLKRDWLPGDYNNTFWGLTYSWANSAVLAGTPVLDYWRPANETNLLGPNTNSYFAKPYFSLETFKNRQPQSKYILNAAYLRLRNLQIGYTVPAKLSRKIAIQKARIFISGGNLATIKSLPKAVDPEQTIPAEDGYNNNGSFYPMAQTFTIGLNLTF